MGDLRMPDLNRVQLAGRLTRDPELTHVGAAGDALCKLGLAVSRKYKTKAGEPRENTVFVDVTCWKGTAEWIGTHAKKGYPLLVDGELQMDEWTDKATGGKRTKLTVNVGFGGRIQQLDWDNNNASPEDGNPEKPKPRLIEEPAESADIPF
jgi:single-strand DNA-binding protein